MLLSCSLYVEVMEKLFGVIYSHIPDFASFSTADTLSAILDSDDIN